MVKTNMKKQRTGCIYKFTNKINKKIYIGKTINWKQRKRVHKHSAKKPTYAFAKALKKHGWDSFEIVILKDGVPEKKLLDLETCYIDVYNSTNPKIGYNVSQTKNHSVKGGGSISFCNTTKKWEVYSKCPERKYIGCFDNKKKAENALDLYNTTGECMPSDIKMRRNGTGSISFCKCEKKWEVVSKRPEKKYIGSFDNKAKAEEALALYNTTGEIILKMRRKGTGTISKVKNGRFQARCKGKFVGLYFTTEKANKALALYNTTGERMLSDIVRRRNGTIIERNGRFSARCKGKSIGTFDTKAEAEEALEKLWRD